MQDMKRYYDSKKAQYGPEQPLKFSGNSITLDIPKEGCNVQDEWKIFPNKPAKVIIYTKGRYLMHSLLQIFKEEVDEHIPESTIYPHCELMAKWMKRDQQLESLVHIVNVQGTTEETYFTINIDPDLPDPGTV